MITGGRVEPSRVVKLHGLPCTECGQPAHAMTVFVDHTTTTHESNAAGYCVTIGAAVERIRSTREGIGTNGYQE